jgi:hypothetical protein
VKYEGMRTDEIKVIANLLTSPRIEICRNHTLHADGNMTPCASNIESLLTCGWMFLMIWGGFASKHKLKLLFMPKIGTNVLILYNYSITYNFFNLWTNFHVVYLWKMVLWRTVAKHKKNGLRNAL